MKEKTIKWLLVCVLFGGIKNEVNAQDLSLQYYNVINQAEMAIVKKEEKQVLDYYRKAFVLNAKKPFSKDLYNAFHCAMDLQLYSLAEQYLAILLNRGLNASFLSNSILKYYHTEDKKVIQAMIDKHTNDTLKNSDLNKQIIRLVAIDQNTRQYYSKIYNGAYMVDSTYKADQYCAKSLLELFRKFGKVPNQQEIGNYDNSILFGLKYSIIILHNGSAYTQHLSSNLFDTIMLKAIFTYDYHPKWFARDLNLADFSHKDRKIEYKDKHIVFPLVVSRYRLPFYLDTVKKAENPVLFNKAVKDIDLNRKKIGLETLEEFWEKEDFTKAAIGTQWEKYDLN